MSIGSQDPDAHAVAVKPTATNFHELDFSELFKAASVSKDENAEKVFGYFLLAPLFFFISLLL